MFVPENFFLFAALKLAGSWTSNDDDDDNDDDDKNDKNDKNDDDDNDDASDDTGNACAMISSKLPASMFMKGKLIESSSNELQATKLNISEGWDAEFASLPKMNLPYQPTPKAS